MRVRMMELSYGTHHASSLAHHPRQRTVFRVFVLVQYSSSRRLVVLVLYSTTVVHSYSYGRTSTVLVQADLMIEIVARISICSLGVYMGQDSNPRNKNDFSSFKSWVEVGF